MRKLGMVTHTFNPNPGGKDWDFKTTLVHRVRVLRQPELLGKTLSQPPFLLTKTQNHRR